MGERDGGGGESIDIKDHTLLSHSKLITLDGGNELSLF